MARNAKQASDRRIETEVLTLGTASPYSDPLDFTWAAGAALYLDPDFAGTVTLQAAVGTAWAYCRDELGSYIQVDDSYAGDWVALDAAAFPHARVRLARTDGAGSAVAPGTAYECRLVLKS